jgi:hypothetical protein
MANQTHEGYSRQEAAVPGSDRSFGLVMAAPFAVLALINFWRFGQAWPWTGASAAVFLAFACLFPAALRHSIGCGFSLGSCCIKW